MGSEQQQSYQIIRQDQILMVDLNGPFTGQIAQAYEQETKTHVEQLKTAPWASLIIFQGDYIFSPEAEQIITELTHYRVDNNMVAIATVFKNNKHADIQQMQLSRIYQQCQVNFHMFSNIDVAHDWLESFLQQKAKRAG